MNKKFTCMYILIVAISLIFIFNPTEVYNSTLESFNLFFNKIYLVLFPFLILGNILIEYNFPYYFGKIFGKVFEKIFKINPSSSFLIFISMITGFPTGAVYINKFFENNIIDETETIKLLSIAFFPSPIFVVFTVGTLLLNNTLFGIIILISLYISNLILGLYLKNNNYKTNSFLVNSSIKSFGVILKESITLSFNTLMLILGNITMFVILSNLLFKNNAYLQFFLKGVLEMTNGINTISSMNINIILKIMLISFFLSFSGLCIHFQTISLINKKIDYKKVFFNRLFASLLTLPITLIISIVIKYFTVIIG